MMMLHRSVAAAAAVQRRKTIAVAGRTSFSRRWMVTKRQKRAAEQKAAATLANASDSVSETPVVSPLSSMSNVHTATPSLIRTDLKDHRQILMEQRQEFDPNEPPPYAPDESGIVKKDLTEAMIDLDDLYDPRLHFNSKTFTDDFEESTPLSEEIIRRIAVSNRPITCAEFVHHALTHPFYGYYTNPTNTSSSSTDDNDDEDWDDDDDDWDNNNDNESPSADHVIGPKGDFVTAPEVSQVFGECLTVWYITQWKETLQQPKEIQFVEVGPGKGTLMADIIRSSLDSFPDFGKSICKIHLVEQSPAMRSEQQKRLSEIVKANWIFESKGYDKDKTDGEKEDTPTNSTASESDTAGDIASSTENNESKPTIRVIWHDNFASVIAHSTKQETNIPSMIVCQEFIDALPINVFEKTEDGWRERLIDINHEPEQSEDGTDTKKNDSSKTVVYQAANENLKFKPEKKTRLRFVVAPGTTPALRTLLNVDNSGRRENDDTEVGQVIEVCPEGILLVQDIKRLLSQHGGGAALIVDYGQEGSADSLRGFSNHKQVHALSLPGKVDVTADVDFEALRHAVNAPPKQPVSQTTGMELEGDDPNPPQAFGPVSQGQFLASMGVMDRVTSLIEDDSTTDEQAEDLYNALERLVLPEHMGERYKVMGIARKKEGIFEPAGFS